MGEADGAPGIETEVKRASSRHCHPAGPTGASSEKNKVTRLASLSPLVSRLRWLTWYGSSAARITMKTYPFQSPCLLKNRCSMCYVAMLSAMIILLPANGLALRAADAAGAAQGPVSERWRDLLDGRTLSGWKVVDFAGGGEVTVEEGTLRLGSGIMLTGVQHTNAVPKVDYEVELEARKLDGYDFFCGLTFPVETSFCTLIVGGWGGGLVGLSSIDNYDASENETTTFMRFERDRWYRIRLRVTAPKIEAWIDDQKMIDLSIVGRKVGLRSGEIESMVPFGVATWQTSSALRNIRLRTLSANGG
jgi:hypothetical protein